MTITALIELAREKDSKFKKQIDHRLNKRKKEPDFDWLIKRLKTILGEEFLSEAAKAEIERQKKGTND